MFRPIIIKTKQYIFQCKEADSYYNDIFAIYTKGFHLQINVYNKDKTCVAIYYKEWDYYVNSNIVYNFIHLFMEKVQIRKKYLIEGKNIYAKKENTEVNQECKKLIHMINHKKPTFQDLSNLKTFGRDKISNIKKEKLTKEISPETLMFLQKTFQSDKDIYSAIRWYLRGLNLDYAIDKVKVDKNIKNDFKK